MENSMLDYITKEADKLGKKTAAKAATALKQKITNIISLNIDTDSSDSGDLHISEEYENLLSEAYDSFLEGFELEWETRFDF